MKQYLHDVYQLECLIRGILRFPHYTWNLNSMGQVTEDVTHQVMELVTVVVTAEVMNVVNIVVIDVAAAPMIRYLKFHGGF